MPRVPAPLLLPAAALAFGIGLGGSLVPRSAPCVAAAFLSLVACARTGEGVGRLLAALGFLLLGMARGSPGVALAPPELPDSLLWQVEVGRTPGDGGGPVPVRLLQALPGPGEAPRWSGRSSASMWIGSWPARAERGDLWLVRGKLLPARRGALPTLFVASPDHALRIDSSARLPDRVLSALDLSISWIQAKARRCIDRGASARVRPLLLALALGERQDFPPDLAEAFSRTGTAHLLSISGLHVGCLAAAILFVLRPLLRRAPLPRSALESGLPDKLAWVAAVTTAAVYVVVAGFPACGRRSLVMLACAAGAQILGRRGSGWNGLAAAVLLVSWFDPAAVGSIGFQLSVISVAGLLALQVPIPGAAGAARWLLSALASSAAATAATAPLCALVWGRVPVSGLWVNPVAIPVLGVGTVPPLLLGAVLGFVDPALGAPLVGFASLVGGFGCRIVEWCALPERCPVVAWQPGPWIVPGLYLLAGLAAGALGGPGEPRPAEVRP